MNLQNPDGRDIRYLLLCENMKLKTLILLLAFSTLVNGLNFFTATVDQPDAPYSQILSGNDVFEQLYGTFNSTGLVLLGGAIVLSAGKISLKVCDNVFLFVLTFESNFDFYLINQLFLLIKYLQLIK